LRELRGPYRIRVSEPYTHPVHEISVQLVPHFVRRRLAVKQGKGSVVAMDLRPWTLIAMNFQLFLRVDAKTLPAEREG
jgi:hypothetical protein